MKNFKDFKIQAAVNHFIGEKIKINKVLNKEIIVLDYKIEDSNYGSGKKCLYLQIEIEKVKRVIFTGSIVLMNMIQEVPKDGGFPFRTTIVEEDERYEFR